jgi:hypothetical protein
MNDYERYDFWHRETVQVKPEVKQERTMKKLVESNRLFDEKNREGFKYDKDDRSEINYPDVYYNIVNI